MWTGKYRFFDYKYNIEGYHGQDYMAPIQFIMVGIGVIIIIILLILLRKMPKDKAKKMVGIFGIVFTLLYVVKTIWESYYDITTGRGFNNCILPFDTCSLFMPALLMAGFAKKDSKLERIGSTCLATIGLVGGISNFIFLRGLNYYPMFTFGGLYSYFWHMAMVFIALFIPISHFHIFEFKDIVYGMILLLAATTYVIPFNYLTGNDYMLINEAAGAPLLEGVADKLIQATLQPLVHFMMIGVYLAFVAIFVIIYHFTCRIKSKE